MRRHGFGWTVGTALVLTAILGGDGRAEAAEFGGSLARAEDRVTLAADRTVAQDLYAAGRLLEISGSVAQDAFLAGARVKADGRTGRDLNAAGEIVLVSGPVDGDVRLLAADLVCSSLVGENALLAGAEVTLTEDARIGQALAAAGAQVYLNGRVGGACWVRGNTVELEGTFLGPVRVWARTLRIGPTARLAAGLTYSADQAADLSPSAEILGPVERTSAAAFGAVTPLPVRVWPARLSVVRWALRLLLAATLFGLGLLAVWLAPQASLRVARSLQDRPWACAGRGLLLLVLGPALILFFVLTVIGLPLAFFLSAAGVLVSFLAKLSAAYGLGLCLLPHAPDRQRWLTFTLGYAVLTVLTFIPFLGPLVNLTAVGLGLGMLWLALSQAPGSEPASVPAAPPVSSGPPASVTPPEPAPRAATLASTARPARERTAKPGLRPPRTPRPVRSRTSRRRSRTHRS